MKSDSATIKMPELELEVRGGTSDRRGRWRSHNRPMLQCRSHAPELPTTRCAAAPQIPSITQRGKLNTIEGLLQTTIEDLRLGQEDRAGIDPATTEKIGGMLLPPAGFLLRDPW